MEIESIPTSLYLCMQIVFKQPKEVAQKFLIVTCIIVWMSNDIYIYRWNTTGGA